jgi:enoyl-CoA hydratase/carnithine racemase
VPKERLSETVFQLAGEIANNAPLALKGTKKILNRIGKSLSMGAEYREEADTLIAEAMNSQDLKEGQAAFMEKRDPVFTGS